jgi:hypothetical protein
MAAAIGIYVFTSHKANPTRISITMMSMSVIFSSKLIRMSYTVSSGISYIEKSGVGYALYYCSVTNPTGCTLLSMKNLFSRCFRPVAPEFASVSIEKSAVKSIVARL